MTAIRVVEIENFRGIKALRWCPTSGFNCLIGPGDSGKSTVLDAIDLCLGARRTIQFTDADFHAADPENTLRILVALGDLDDSLQSIDTYGEYLRGFNSEDGSIEDEPGLELETVLTVELIVGEDLEPSWKLRSDRTEETGLERGLRWSDRVRVAPLRIGTRPEDHVSWRQGSALTKISKDFDVSRALAQATRAARLSFGSEGGEQAELAIDVVRRVASDLGIDFDGDLAAMLDAKSVSMRAGAVSLHHGKGIPARALGTGSMRLLAAGLVRAAGSPAPTILIDELESGLEPHRALRLLDSLGAKDSQPGQQVIASTHSPVVVCELSGDQLFVMRRIGDRHRVIPVGTTDAMQGAARKYPDAFLAKTVVVCEGASEVGFVRGLDQYRVEVEGGTALAARGVALIDGTGGSPDELLRKGCAFLSLGFGAAVFRDDDKSPTGEVEHQFVDAGGAVLAWSEGRALEDELFVSLSTSACGALVNLANELIPGDHVDKNIESASDGALRLDAVLEEIRRGSLGATTRIVLGLAAKRGVWFKSVGKMERVGREIVGPTLDESEESLKSVVGKLFEWVTRTSGRE